MNGRARSGSRFRCRRSSTSRRSPAHRSCCTRTRCTPGGARSNRASCRGWSVARKCGYALSRASGRSSARRIHYYRCIGSDGWRHLGGPRCDTRPVRQDLLDEVVWTEVIRLLEEPALIQQELDRRLAAAQAADPTKKRTRAVERGPRASRQEHGAATHRLPGGSAVARGNCASGCRCCVNASRRYATS